tara:strand:- start:182 stop:340 length:159 start_codon:yes stop_codon:yes gene_type:complete
MKSKINFKKNFFRCWKTPELKKENNKINTRLKRFKRRKVRLKVEGVLTQKEE